MNNKLTEPKSWGKRNWKWLVPVIVIISIPTGIFFSSGMNGVANDLAQAYLDNELYENAIKKAKSDEITNLLSEIQPIDKLAILEGQVEYSNNNKTVFSSIRIVGTKGKANLDISAHRIDHEWNYNKINIRIKSPSEKKQTIEIVTTE